MYKGGRRGAICEQPLQGHLQYLCKIQKQGKIFMSRGGFEQYILSILQQSISNPQIPLEENLLPVKIQKIKERNLYTAILQTIKEIIVGRKMSQKINLETLLIKLYTMKYLFKILRSDKCDKNKLETPVTRNTQQVSSKI